MLTLPTFSSVQALFSGKANMPNETAQTHPLTFSNQASEKPVVDYLTFSGGGIHTSLNNGHN